MSIHDTLTGALTRADYGTLAGEQVGNHTITQGTLASSTNYTLSFTPGVTFAINPAAATATPYSGQHKTYGLNDPTLTYGTTGLVNGIVDGVTINDTLTGALTRADYGTLAGEQVGNHTITQGTLASSTNYTLSFTPGVTFAINAAAATATPHSGQHKTYGLNDPTLTYGTTGLVNGIVDGVTINDTLTGALTRADYGTLAGEHVGNHTITQGTLASSTNYTLSFTPGVTFAINTAAATATPDSGQHKTYGLNDPTLTYGTTGLVKGIVDGVTINDTLTGALTRADYGTLAGEQVGNHTITQGTLASSTNYTLSFTPGVTFAINAAAATATPNSGQHKTYGLNDPTLTYGTTGLVNGIVDGVTINDTLTGALTRADYGTLAGEQVGNHTITQGTLASSTNYTLSFTPGVTFAINAAAATATPNSGQHKTYGLNDPTLTYGTTGLVNGIVDGVTINDTLTGALTRADYGTLAGEQVGNHTITQGTLASSTNYTLSFTPGVTFAINAAAATATPNSGQHKTYGLNDPTLTYGTTGLVNGIVDGVTINDTLTGALTRADYGTLAGEQVGNHTITQGTLASSTNYTLSFTPGVTFAIDPATLTYVANPQLGNFGSPPPALTGTVTGFVNNETLASATTGTATWTTPATSTSPQGFYPIDGSGLTANHGNYVFVQAAGNATALQIGHPLPNNTGPSTFTPPQQPPPTNTVNIPSPNTGNNLFHVSFTPNGPSTANNQTNNANPASLPPGDKFTHNNGFDFQPISQYDANQYSDFKLPDYDNDDGEAAIFTILARAASPGHGGDYMINNFWNGTGATWPGAGNINLSDKVTFSDGAGHDATPSDGTDAFPIVPGKTDFAQLLKSGPVMIGGPAGQTPTQWLLATGLTPDGKDIVCDDPVTGKLIELAYDPTTETVGGIAGVFDPKSKGFVSLADAGGDVPAGAGGGLAALQSFVPSTYYAVTMH